MLLLGLLAGAQFPLAYLTGKELHSRRAGALWALGLLVPAALYLAVNGRGDAAGGWGVVIGTDTAFLLGALTVVGPRLSTQLRLFLLTMSVVDDILAVTVIGVAYSDAIHWPSLAVAVACLIALVALARRGVWQASPYVLVVLVLWLSTLRSGLHASIAGMLSGLLVPAVAARRDLVEDAARAAKAFRQSPLPSVGRTARRGIVRAVSVNERLQEVLLPWTTFVVVPLFALANAGVDLRDGVLGAALRSPVTWGVVLGLVVGKLVGISFGAFTAVRLRWGRLPQGVGPGQVVGGAALSGIGFTVSLLIAELAFGGTAEHDDAVADVERGSRVRRSIAHAAPRTTASAKPIPGVAGPPISLTRPSYLPPAATVF